MSTIHGFDEDLPVTHRDESVIFLWVYYSTVLTRLHVGQRVPYHRPRAALLRADVSRQGRFDNGSITRCWCGNRACLCPCWCTCSDPCSLEATEIRSSTPGAQVFVVPADIRGAQAVNAAIRATQSRFEKGRHGPRECWDCHQLV